MWAWIPYNPRLPAGAYAPESMSSISPDTHAGRSAVGTGSSPEDARNIGRGGVYLTCTKLYFLLSSYLIYWGLAAVGGDNLLGRYKQVNALLTVFSTVLVTGTMQAVAHYVGRHGYAARTIKLRALPLQAGVGLLVAAVYYFGAPLVAGEEELRGGMRVAAGIPLVYAVYAVFLGTLNGQRRYTEQALVDGGFTTAKLVLVIGATAVTGTVAGSFAGFLGAALVVLAGGALLTNRGHGDQVTAAPEAPRAGRLLRFQLQTVGFMVLMQWAVQMDIWYVDWLAPYSTKELQDGARTIYGTSQLFASVSYSLAMAVTFVVFPLVSATAADTSPEKTRSYVRGALRFALIIVAGVTAVLSSTPVACMDLLLDQETLRAFPAAQQQALSLLGPAFIFLALFFVLCSVLNAAGKPRLSMMLGLVMVALQAGLGVLLTPRLELLGQATAGLAAMGTACLLAVWTVRRGTGPLVPWATVVRLAVAAGAVVALSRVWVTRTEVGTLVRFAVEGLLFLLVLVLLGEAGPEDRRRLARVLGRRGRG